MRRVLSAVAVAAALVSLAACGGGDDEDASTTTTVAVVTTAPSQTTPTFTGDSNSAFCEVARANIARIQEIGNAAAQASDLGPLLREAAPAVRQIASVAPPEIKGDVTVLAEGFEKLLASTEAGEADISVFLEPRFQTAANNLTAYGRDVCGITG